MGDTLKYSYITIKSHVLLLKKSKNQIKSSLYSLNTLSGVTSERCPSPRLTQYLPRQKQTSYHLSLCFWATLNYFKIRQFLLIKVHLYSFGIICFTTI